MKYNNVQRRVLEKSFGSTGIGTNVLTVVIPTLLLYDEKNVSYVLYKMHNVSVTSLYL